MGPGTARRRPSWDACAFACAAAWHPAPRPPPPPPAPKMSGTSQPSARRRFEISRKENHFIVSSSPSSVAVRVLPAVAVRAAPAVSAVRVQAGSHSSVSAVRVPRSCSSAALAAASGADGRGMVQDSEAVGIVDGGGMVSDFETLGICLLSSRSYTSRLKTIIDT